MRRGELPAELWFGSEHAFQYPQFYRTSEMLEFFREVSEDWLSIVPNLAMQQNLIGYLSMPDLTWAYGSANVTAAYLRAYVAYLSVVVTEYDAYMFVQDQPMKIPDVPLGWRGPAWLDWKIMKPAKKVYNANRRKADKMHGLWLLDPLLESQLRKMIPVLMSKMIDPCFLQDAASYFPNKLVFRNEEFLGQPEDMLCSIYCRFSNAVTKLYRDSGSEVCYLMDAGSKRYGGQCRGDRCYCLRNIESKKKDYTLSATLRYCVNVFNMQQYNDTHTCRPEI
nr:PREDICTED: uncharacterized protein LOC109033783 isoform X2 [Bemisia tabaci]